MICAHLAKPHLLARGGVALRGMCAPRSLVNQPYFSCAHISQSAHEDVSLCDAYTTVEVQPKSHQKMEMIENLCRP